MAAQAFVLSCLCAALSAQGLVQVDVALPTVLDLRNAAAGEWVPRDARDPLQVEASARAWSARVGPQRAAPAVRLLLPAGPDRLPLLLAAAQALKAQNPEVTLYLGFERAAPPWLDETAWGALDGGALTPAELGPDPALWRDRLMEAQAQFPGRPWTLWLPSDPGPRLAELLGDGARLVVPGGGPASRLAPALPGAFTEVEAGFGDLTLRRSRPPGALRWRFQGAEWVSAPAAADRPETSVTTAERYDVGALLARLRARQLADLARLRTREGKLKVELHLQAEQGPGVDLGFSFRFFEAAGEPEETLQQEVRFNGVKARLNAGLQLPIIESRSSLAAPAVLNLTERYRYQDGGSAGAGLRRIRFEPAVADPLLFSGDLLVDEGSGRILEERSRREGLPGTVKSERRVLSYGEAGDGTWRMVRARTFERWLSPGGVMQVQRNLDYTDFQTNQPGFAASRSAARASEGTMLRSTVEGLRYFNKQKDGTRQVEARPRSAARALGAVLLVDPTLPAPVVPLAGLAYFDFNAWNRGIQINALTAILFNQAQVTVPQAVAGCDFTASTTSLLLAATERPIVNGRLADRDGVGRRFGNLNLALGHDLGAGFRFEGSARFQFDAYSQPREDAYRTPGFTLPPSGWTRELRGELTWLHSGLQLAGYFGRGQRPDGLFGAPGATRDLADQGRYQRWGGSASCDLKLDSGAWLHGETGLAGGSGFDRFKALSIGGIGGDVRIAGIRSSAVTADRLSYAKAGVVFPAGPRMRLTLSLDQAAVRSQDDQVTRGFTGLGAAGDLPGFWWFTTVRMDLGVGLLSTMPGVRSVNGFVALLRVF